MKNIQTFAVLYMINEKAHFSMKSFDTDDAMNKMYEMIEYLDNGKAAVYAVSDEDETAGFAWVYPTVQQSERSLHIKALVVREDKRGRGLGQQLYRTIFNSAREEGINIIETWVDTGNIRARKLYDRIGFEPVMYQLVKKLLVQK